MSWFNPSSSAPLKEDPVIQPATSTDKKIIIVSPQGLLPSSIEQKLLLRRLVANRASSRGHSTRKGKGFTIQTIPVMSGKLLVSTASSGGTCSGQANWSTFISSADYTALASLFDMVRIVGLRMAYHPVGPGQGPSLASNSPLHGGCVFSLDLDATGAVSYDTLVGTRPMSDKRNLHSTSDKLIVDHKFNIPAKNVHPFSGTSALVVDFGQWINVQNVPSAVTGALQYGVITQSYNATALAYGDLVVEFTAEWAFRE
jgi:hypothetical protein